MSLFLVIIKGRSYVLKYVDIFKMCRWHKKYVDDISWICHQKTTYVDTMQFAKICRFYRTFTVGYCFDTFQLIKFWKYVEKKPDICAHFRCNFSTHIILILVQSYIRNRVFKMCRHISNVSTYFIFVLRRSYTIYYCCF